MSGRRDRSPGSVLDRPDGSPRVDPRLRARRIEVRRREGRRRLRRLLVAVGVTVACAGAWAVTRSALLDVDQVEVLGARRVSVDAVLGAGGIEVGQPLVDLDLGAARRGIAAMPWIESAAVSRSWWGTVTYELVERVPVAVVHDDEGRPWLVDHSGRVLDAATPADGQLLPHVEGIGVVDIGHQLTGLAATGVELAAMLTPGIDRWVAAVTVEADELWLELRPEELAAIGPVAVDPPRVRVGDARDLPAQLVAIETVLTRVDLSCVALLDVRVPASPVVTRDARCEDGTSA